MVLYAYMWGVNKKRDREAAADFRGQDEREREAVDMGMQDITEIENKGFRYVL